MEREYRKIVLGEHHRRQNDIDLLCELGGNGWELVAITPNNVAYLKREVGQEVNRTLAGEGTLRGSSPSTVNRKQAKRGRVAAGWQLGSNSSRMRVRISRSIASSGIDLLIAANLGALAAVHPNPRRDPQRTPSAICFGAQRLVDGARMAERAP